MHNAWALYGAAYNTGSPGNQARQGIGGTALGVTPDNSKSGIVADIWREGGINHKWIIKFG